jgi:AcrR family transcriptional regulator
MNKTKRRIFNTAVELFSAKGYDNTNIEEITAVAGVAKGTLYYHFTKKEDIFDLLLEEGLKLLKNNIELKTRSCNTALEKIKAVTLVQIKVIVKYESFLNVIFSELWGEEGKNIKCKKAVFEYIKILEKITKEGIDNGEFYDGNVEALASGIFGITVSSLIYRLKKNREVNVEEVYKGFIDTVVRGLRK